MNRDLMLLLSVAVAPLALSAQSEQKMNVLFILVDDFGYECVTANGGGSYSTPNMDRMAEMGVRFTNCYANPLSTPTRVQLLTGRYNIKNYIAFGRLDRDEATFSSLLHGAGYRTAIAGKWQLGKESDSPQHFGFEKSCLWQHMLPATENGDDTRYAWPVMEYNSVAGSSTTEDFGPDKACDFLVDFIRESSDKPFFAYYPMILTHCPFVATPDSQEWRGERSPTYKGDAKFFSDMVSYADMLVGRLLDELESQGVLNNTLIILAGDNGTDTPVVSMLDGKPYAGAKGETTNGGTHVPLMVVAPGGLQGHVSDELVDFTDFFPTVCQAVGITPDSDIDLDGLSIMPQIYGERSRVRDWVYCWFSRDLVESETKIFARDKRYKLYKSGEFYDLQSDELERSAMDVDALSRKEKNIYKSLERVIGSYHRQIP